MTASLKSSTKIGQVPINYKNIVKDSDKANSLLCSIFNSTLNFNNPQKMQVTPDIAEKILERNFNNRKIRENYVGWLSAQMASGLWTYNARTISFDSEGILLDGQHTMKAIIKSNTSQYFNIQCNIEKKAQMNMDSSGHRVAGDFFEMGGIKNSNRVASIVKGIMTFGNGQLIYSITGKSRELKYNSDNDAIVSNSTILDFYFQNKEEIDTVVTNANYFYGYYKGITPTEYGLLYYMFSKKNHDDAWEFLSKFSTNIGLSQNSPITVLRRRIDQISFSKLKISKGLKLYYFIYCWNKFRKGEDLKVLQTPQKVEIEEIL